MSSPSPILLLGAHLSIAGGYHHAVEKARSLGCTALQIFTKNQVRWKSKPIKKTDVRLYKSALSESPKIRLVCAHGSYLYNFASPSRALIARSIRCLRDELARCSALGLPFIIIHPGCHRGSSVLKGIERVCSCLETVLCKDFANGGAIGREAFGFIMSDERLLKVPKIIETPKKLKKRDMDPVNLVLLRDMSGLSFRRRKSG